MTTKNSATISSTNINAWPEPLDNDSPIIAPGKRDTIPIIINIDVPFPTPLSVILSPSHIQKIVPAVIMNTDEIVNTVLLTNNASDGIVDLK